MERKKKEVVKKELNEPLVKKKPVVKKPVKKTKKTPSRKSVSLAFNIHVSLVVDVKFWGTPSINFNDHSKELEIEILCFGIYLSILKDK